MLLLDRLGLVLPADAADRSRPTRRRSASPSTSRRSTAPTRRSRRPSKNIAIATFPGWGKDYADPLTFFQPLFNGRTIIPQGNTNYSLVGVKPSQAKSLGVTGDVQGVPSVDPQLDRCAALAGQARLTCYETLDRTLMTNVVPWVPWLFLNAAHIVGPKVTQWGYDQFDAATAYAHVAVSS